MNFEVFADKARAENNLDNSYYLVHFFGVFDQNLEQQGSWEIGFYNPEKDVVMTCVCGDAGLSKESEVLKKKKDIIKPLDLSYVEFSFSSCVKKVAEVLRNNYLNEVPIKGFIVLQNLSGYPIWNVSLITRSLHTLNIKINAENGNVEHHGVIQLHV